MGSHQDKEGLCQNKSESQVNNGANPLQGTGQVEKAPAVFHVWDKGEQTDLHIIIWNKNA